VTQQPRVMVRWVAGGRVVGMVLQGVQAGPAGRPVAVYIASVAGFAPDPCPRFQCAVTKVEAALGRMGVVAAKVMA
jgi:hypothetical protein